jgi:hypothetical protein
MAKKRPENVIWVSAHLAVGSASLVPSAKGHGEEAYILLKVMCQGHQGPWAGWVKRKGEREKGLRRYSDAGGKMF